VNRRQALAETRKTLENGGIENSSLEGEILLRFLFSIDRANLFASLENAIPRAQETQLAVLVQRRLQGEPSAYITGHKEFYGLDFKVDKRVLIPRPETEMLVEKALDFCRANKCETVADTGTGSGCIAVSLAKNLPDVMIYAVDYSRDALTVAGNNAKSHGVSGRITLIQGDLLKDLQEPVDVIIANLPYVKKSDVDSRYEPEMALDGGLDGLDKINRLVTQLPGKLKPGGLLLLEVGSGQAEEVKATLHKAFAGAFTEIYKDLAGIDRVVSLRLTL
jgi:release factor glutamine methyltransferase